MDNRESALKGGEHGIDIIPGQGSKSLLIQYVAGLVEDMEMPPLGKNKPLTPEQISLLRAWIDQGAAWDANGLTNNWTFSISPIIGGTAVSGDAAKFREHYWQRTGVNGGIAEFEAFQQIDPETRSLMTGHVLADDYKLNLSVDRDELGFIHGGWEQYRKYYDNIGGYDPAFTPPVSSLDRDLHVDIGKAWIDFGLTLPHWPRMVLGYEYDYRQGEEAITEWGAEMLPDGTTRNIAPASKNLHEGTHILKFDLDHELWGVTIEDRFRGEFYQLTTGRTNVTSPPEIGNLQADNIREGYSYFQGANTIRLERKFNDWLFASGGYLYSKLNADASFNLDTMNISGFSIGDSHFNVPQITLSKESHVGNLNALLGPFEGLTLSTGVQAESSRQHSFGTGNLAQTFPGSPTIFDNPAVLGSDYDETSVTETVALRYTKIPFTALFAEGSFQQQRIGQSDFLTDDVVDGSDFLQDTRYSSQLTDFRAGFNTSPWREVSFTAHYRRYEENDHFQNSVNQQFGFAGSGYPGFLNSRDQLTDEVEAKLAWHPCRWLKTSLSYIYSTTDYWENTAPVPPGVGSVSPGGNILSGQSTARTYSFNATMTPLRRLYLSGTFSYSDTGLDTAANGATAITPYRGNTYSVIANSTYNLSAATDLFLAYDFSESNYGQNDFVDGLPVGIDYQEHQVQFGLAHHWNKNVSTKLQYMFAYYDEPTSGGAANYRAHSIFATVTFKFQ